MIMERENVAQGQQAHRQGRRLAYLLLFCLLLVLAGLSSQWGGIGTAAAQTVPGGTITPGGTLPPPPTLTAGTGLVRVIHLAPFDNTIADTAVDICTGNNTPVTGLTNLAYLEQSGYIPLSPGPYDWTVATPGCGTVVLDLPAFTLQPGMVLTLLVVGGGNQPLSSVLLVEQSGQAYLYLPLIAKV